MGEKYTLTEDEKLVIEIYRACEQVIFYKHRCEEEEASRFTNMLGEDASFEEADDKSTSWYSQEKKLNDKTVEVIGFLNRRQL